MDIPSNPEAGTSRILREADVRHRTGVSRTTRWRMERQGKFPKRVRLGDRSIGWMENEIKQWMESLPRGAR